MEARIPAHQGQQNNKSNKKSDQAGIGGMQAHHNLSQDICLDDLRQRPFDEFDSHQVIVVLLIPVEEGLAGTTW